MHEEFWNERYRSSSALWSANPNSELVREASDLIPGSALDIGCGEGADARAPPEATYELVSAQFMHLPRAERESLFSRLAAPVAPGGHLLIVGHYPSDLQTTARRPQLPDLLYTASDVAAGLDPLAWTIVVSASRERTTTDPEGRTVAIHDTVLRAQR